MMEKKTDRRVLRSMKMLRTALVREIEEKDYDVITISDIVKRADLNRSTFYAHYQDKHDLLQQSVRDVFAELTDGLREFISPNRSKLSKAEKRVAMVKVFELVMENADFYRVILLIKGDLKFTSQLEEVFASMIASHVSQLDCEKNEEEIPMDLFYAYATSSIIGIIKWWIKSELKYSPSFMASKLEQLITEGSKLYD